ncbi:MAG: hypothetical protein R3A48_11360 [Polyangiales bacterium]
MSQDPHDELLALITPLLPPDWRDELAVSAHPEQLVVSLRDTSGARHAFDLRPMLPGAPSLVPGERLAYSYVASPEQRVDEALLGRYRAVLEAMRAREDALAPHLRPAVAAPRESAPVTHGVGPERLAFELGIKPALRVVLAEAPETEALSREARARGWGFYAPEEPLRFTRYTQRVAYLARSDEDALRLADAEAPMRPGEGRVALGDAASNARVGRLLGYPACCTEAFAARVERGVTLCPEGRLAHEDYAAARWAMRDVARAESLLNNLLPDDGGARLITWYPCRYDCAASTEFARALLDAVRARAPEQARAWSDELRGRRGIDREGRRLRGDERSDDDPLWIDFEGG